MAALPAASDRSGRRGIEKREMENRRQSRRFSVHICPEFSPARLRLLTGMARSTPCAKKRAGISRREKPDTGLRQSGLGHHIGYCEKNNDSERADQEHVAHVMTRDAGAHFGRAFHNTIVFYVRHRSLHWQQRRNNNAACPAAVPQRPRQRVQMWSVPKVYPGSVTLSRLFS